MANIITHNQIMSEIKASLSHILHSLTELSARINKPPHTPSVQPSITPAPLSPSPPSSPTTPSISLSKTTFPSSYPIKRLTYSEMQQLRDQGLCLNCNDIDIPSHRCPVQRILLVLPDEDLNIEQQSMEIHAATVTEQLTSQDMPLHSLNHASDPKALQFQADVLNSPFTTLIHMSTTHHYLHPKTAQFLGLQIDKLSTFSVVENEEKMRGNGPCHDDYTLYCMDLHECMIKPGKSKVFVFDPGGVIVISMFLFDLEDKVDFKGSVMIGFGTMLMDNMQAIHLALHHLLTLPGRFFGRKANEIVTCKLVT